MVYNDKIKQNTIKYLKNNLDNISFRLPKEKKNGKPTKEEITNHVKKHGYQSTQQFLITAINTQMALDEKKNKK